MKTIPLLLALTFPLMALAQTLDDARKPGILIGAEQVHRMSYRGRPIQGHGAIVAVLDTGINSLHPHLFFKIAKNKDEVADGIDNDRNGYIDDLIGWNFFHNNGTLGDDHGHGTHVSGTIVADQYGIAPAASLVPVKISVSPKGEISDRHLIDGIKYAADNGARIINLSIRGIYDYMPVTAWAIKEAVEYARQRNVLLVVAAGNDGLDITDTQVLPANIKSDNLITVCAVDDNARLANFSNYSSTAVHLCAPGVNIASANRSYFAFSQTGNPFKVLSGTSMATPIVAGVAALLWSMEPGLTAKEIKNIILTSARNRKQMTPHLMGASTTGGTLSAIDAVAELMKRKNIYR